MSLWQKLRRRGRIYPPLSLESILLRFERTGDQTDGPEVRIFFIPIYINKFNKVKGSLDQRNQWTLNHSLGLLLAGADAITFSFWQMG